MSRIFLTISHSSAECLRLDSLQFSEQIFRLQPSGQSIDEILKSSGILIKYCLYICNYVKKCVATWGLKFMQKKAKKNLENTKTNLVTGRVYLEIRFSGIWNQPKNGFKKLFFIFAKFLAYLIIIQSGYNLPLGRIHLLHLRTTGKLQMTYL